MKFIVVWQSNYNGVSVHADWDNMDEYEATIVDQHINEIDDEVADTLPSYTYKVASRWDGLTDEHISELKRLALVIINKYFPEVTIEDLKYNEDPYST